MFFFSSPNNGQHMGINLIHKQLLRVSYCSSFEYKNVQKSLLEIHTVGTFLNLLDTDYFLKVVFFCQAPIE